MSQPAHVADDVPPPGLGLLFSEGRALFELGWFLQALPLLRRAPRGDGHPVMVLPGFTASDVSTGLLRSYLRAQGYQVRGWGLGRNLGFSQHLEARMARRLQSFHWTEGRQVSLIGWSLGGIFARELARAHPEMVRQVISLGAPFAASPRSTNVWRVYERVTRQPIDEIDRELLERMRTPPPVPSTAIYSESDGIASWRACVEAPGERTDNVRIPGSHCGLGVNPLAAWVIADRLAQPADAWRHFEPSGLERFAFPRRPQRAP